MAAVLNDYVSQPSRFHTMIASQSIQHHHPTSYAHTHDAQQPQRSASRSQPKDESTPARLPSPPSSSSPTKASPALPADDAKNMSMDTAMSTTGVDESSSQQPSWQQLSPAASTHQPSSEQPLPVVRSTVVHVRDLAHVKALAASNTFTNPTANDHTLEQTKYDISAMPVDDIIEMVAALLTKITSTNDQQHDALQRNVTHQQQANQSSDSPGGSSSPFSHSVLAFHGKNVPGITILSYLARIHKYCPTTFEVFLSLLVYFDRMTERVNDLVTKSEEARRSAISQAQPKRAVGNPPHPQPVTSMRESQVVDDEMDSDLADDDDDTEKTASTSGLDDVPALSHGPSTYFVVDSFNIHRLMIAGVTCSSKFFSDVFYTNSRYAKVGGLPLAELNHLELQFLILNDFRLAIPVEELEAYATMLVEFYGREMSSQAQATGERKG